MTTLALLFLIGSSSFLQVARTTIAAIGRQKSMFNVVASLAYLLFI